AVAALLERAAATGTRTALSIYPWDIVTEIETRLESPQAMLLVVPNGKVKLLNALPFAPADLRRDSLETAWRAARAALRGGGGRWGWGSSSADAAGIPACSPTPTRRGRWRRCTDRHARRGPAPSASAWPLTQGTADRGADACVFGFTGGAMGSKPPPSTPHW